MTPTPASVLERQRPWRLSPFLRGSVALHAVGLGALGWNPASWPWILGALAANHLGIAVAGLVPRSRVLGPNLLRLPLDATADGRVALTFDDGPDPEITPRVLDLLDEHGGTSGAKASFFVIGERVEREPALTREIVRRGHLVENHSYRHAHTFSLLPPRALAREVERAQDVIAQSTGRYPVWFRAPAGLRGVFLEPILARQGLALAAWTRRGYDTVSTEPHTVYQRLVRNLAAGDVLLLHDRLPHTGGARRTSPALEVLPRLLAELAARGLHAGALPDRSPSLAAP